MSIPSCSGNLRSPIVLYAKGRLLPRSNSIAIVGAHPDNPLRAGHRLQTRVPIAGAGITVVSGGHAV